jgi:predicted metal-dependent hydrolase
MVFRLGWSRLVTYRQGMSHKSAKIALLVEHLAGSDLSPHYLGYFECFNRGLFYEAHDVLEELWLSVRRGPNDGFYKALIQFAGAFVHLQKNRLRPAASLFKLSKSYLQPYLPENERLDVAKMVGLIDEHLAQLEAGDYAVNPLTAGPAPQLALNPPL